MKLAKLLSPWMTDSVNDIAVSGINNDSRKIKSGDLFIAYPGAAVDGRLFCEQAIKAGASAIAYDPDNLPVSFVFEPNIEYVAVPQLANQLAVIASRFYDCPSTRLAVTGVTGTNGKTTIAWQLAQAYHALGFKAAYIGTLGHGDFHALNPLGNTTPDALCLQQFFDDYVHRGINQVCMEVSSHALDQGRVDCIDFQQALFTNLSHEHLDYHLTMEAYAAAKARLFAMPTLKSAVLNFDDEWTGQLAAGIPASCQKLTYGMHPGADVRARDLQISMTGSRFRVDSPWGSHDIAIKTLGVFNVYNSLAVFTGLMANGHDIGDVIRIMAHLEASPGRMELVISEPCVIVDYAHTPDALENVLKTLDKLKQGRLLVVFGCGGDRDRTKRPLMGKIASQYADQVIVTSDNPRTEDPEAIIDEVVAGLLPNTASVKVTDRAMAIHRALDMAGQQDIVLIAGKGHEDYQQIGHQRIPFSDQGVVRKWQESAG